MAVNLTGIELSGAAPAPAPKTSTSPGPSAGSQDSPASEPEVSITSTASLLANLEQSLASQPAVDSQRVAALSKALADGTYRVQPGKVAGGLLQSERALDPLPRQEI